MKKLLFISIIIVACNNVEQSNNSKEMMVEVGNREVDSTFWLVENYFINEEYYSLDTGNRILVNFDNNYVLRARFTNDSLFLNSLADVYWIQLSDTLVFYLSKLKWDSLSVIKKQLNRNRMVLPIFNSKLFSSGNGLNENRVENANLILRRVYLRGRDNFLFRKFKRNLVDTSLKYKLEVF